MYSLASLFFTELTCSDCTCVVRLLQGTAFAELRVRAGCYGLEASVETSLLPSHSGTELVIISRCLPLQAEGPRFLEQARPAPELNTPATPPARISPRHSQLEHYGALLRIFRAIHCTISHTLAILGLA